MKCKWYITFPAALLMAALLFVPVSAGEENHITIPEMLSSWSRRGAEIDEASLGDALADALRFTTRVDAAIVNGGDIPDNALQPGPRTRKEIEEAVSKDRTIGVAEISVPELKELLEICVGHITVDLDTKKLDEEASAFGGFPQVSGFTFGFDALAEPGERVMWIKGADGKRLDLTDEDRQLTMAASEYLLSGGWGAPAHAYESSGLTYSDALADYFASDVKTDYSRIRRIYMAGGSTETIIDSIPPWAIAMLVAVIGLFGFLRGRQRRKAGADEWDEWNEDPEDRPFL